MPEEKNNNKIITFVLAMIIFIAILTIVYINLPEEKESNGNTIDDEKDLIFNLTFGDEFINYTVQDLEALEEFNGNGTFIKTGWLPDVALEGPYNFTGIRLTTLLNQIENLPNNYTVRVTSSDGWSTDYNKTTIYGQVNIYNESGNITQTGGVTMVLAYKEDGIYITDPDEGPLRIVFLNEGKITSSKLWAKMVVEVELIELL